MKKKLITNLVLETIYFLVSIGICLFLNNYYGLSNESFFIYALGMAIVVILVLVLTFGFGFNRFCVMLFEFYIQTYLSSQVNYFNAYKEYYLFNIKNLFGYCDLNLITLLILVINIIFAVIYFYFEFNRKYEEKVFYYRIFAAGLISFAVLINTYQEKRITYPRYFYDFQINTDPYYSYLHFDTMSDQFVENYGIYNFLIKDIEDKISKSDKDEETKEIDNFFANRIEHPDNAFTNIFKDKNVLFIQVNNFTLDQINESVPAIARLWNEGYQFRKFNAQNPFGKASDTEFSTNLSIYPDSIIDYSCYKDDDNYYPLTLAKAFKDNEYNTDIFYPDYKIYYNRENMFEIYGYDRLLDMEALYSSAKLTNDDLFRWYRYYLWSYRSTGQKYMAYMIANDDEGLTGLDPYINDLLTVDLNAEDLVIVLFGDGLRNSDDFNNSGLIIYERSAGVNSIGKALTPVDILPTINNLFGLNADVSCSMGEDVFNDNFAGSYINPRGIEYSLDETKIRMDISNKILKYDYFAKSQ